MLINYNYKFMLIKPLVLVLQTELGNGQMHHAVFIRRKSMPLHQQIEGGHREGQTHLKICPFTMHDLFEMAHQRQHRKHGLNHHPLIPCASQTDLEILRVTFFGVKARVATDDHLILVLFDERLKDCIRDIRRVTVPGDDEAEFIQEQAELTTDNPAPVRQPLASILPRRAAFSDGMNQLDAIRVNDTQDGRLSHESLGPRAVCLEQTEEARSFWQIWKQRLKVTHQPAIKGTVADAFDSKHESQADNLAWMKRGLAVFGYLFHLVIYTTEQFSDKVLRGHDSCLRLQMVWSPLH